MLGSSKELKAAQATKNDYELFLQAFQKPTQIYKLLGYRHCVNPLFLHRNTSYMRHRRSLVQRTPKTIESIIKDLSKKAVTEERNKSKEGSYKITITNIDNKINSTKSMETYDIQLHLHKLTHREKHEKYGGGRKLSLQHKLHIVELFERNPDLTMAAVAREFGHSHSTVRYIKARSEEIKQAALLDPLTDSSSSTEAEEPPIASLKFTSNDKKSAVRSPSKVPSAITIRCSTLNKHSSGQGSILEFRVKLRSVKSNTKESSPLKKRRCVEEWFSAQLILHNETGTTILGDGSYTLFLRPISGDTWRPSQVSWETVSSTEEDTCIKTEVLDSDEVPGCSSISFDVKTDSCHSVALSPRKSPKKFKNVSLKSEETKGVLMYNFLYNGNTLQQTECRKNRVCPWCSLNCKKLYSLLEHITQCHPRFKVTFIPGLNGYDEVDVEVNELQAMCPIPRPDEDRPVPIFSGPNRREDLFQLQMLRSLTRTKRSKSDFMVIDIAPYKTSGHSRLYFHSKSYEPILPHEFEYDSENDESMSWMEEKTKQLIQDFTDVNEAEKAIMIMWNCFILPKRPLADHQVPVLARQFVAQQGREIIRRGLVKNLILHLTNLHSFGLLKADDLESVVLSLYAMEPHIKEFNSNDKRLEVIKEFNSDNNFEVIKEYNDEKKFEVIKGFNAEKKLEVVEEFSFEKKLAVVDSPIEKKIEEAQEFTVEKKTEESQELPSEKKLEDVSSSNIPPYEKNNEEISTDSNLADT